MKEWLLQHEAKVAEAPRRLLALTSAAQAGRPSASGRDVACSRA